MTETELNLPGAVGAAAARAQRTPQLPAQPRNVQETGLELGMLVELLSKAIFLAGKSHLSALAGRLRLPVNVLHEVLAFMLAEQMAEVARRGDADIDVAYQLTALGRQRAAEYLARCRYLGPAPVALEAYRDMVLRQSLRASLRERALGPADIAAAFADMSLSAHVRNLIGAAMVAGRALFLYGPPGCGKTTLARRLGRLLQDVVALPYALAVGHQIIEVFDPAQHGAAGTPHALREQARQAGERRNTDQRWAVCERPVLRLGAELCAPMLETQRDAGSGYYQAPVHFKANNGMLIIDDLGRQRIACADLLQRWAGPLEHGEDHLSLDGGHRFAVPFDTMLVFATSMDPAALLDASFMRRLGYRIALGALAEEQYRTLFRQQCLAARLVYDETVLRHLVERLHRVSGRALLASTPQELIGRILDFASFAGEPARLSVPAIEQAWHSLFGAAAGAAPLPWPIDDFAEIIE
jgi:energy-coupling factor transporter ATP-binding protein EcfA2